MEAKTIPTPKLPPKPSADGLMEQGPEKALDMRVMGPKSKVLVREIKALEAAQGEKKEREEDLLQEIADRTENLNVLRASSLLEELDLEEEALLEAGADVLQENELRALQSTLAGIDLMLYQKRQALPAAQMGDAQAALDKSVKRLARGRQSVLTVLETAATSLQEAGLMKKFERWRELVRERWTLYDQFYSLTGIKSIVGNDADRKMRTEGAYKLFPDDDVSEAILDLAEAMLLLYEIRNGWPAVIGRKQKSQF